MNPKQKQDHPVHKIILHFKKFKDMIKDGRVGIMITVDGRCWNANFALKNRWFFSLGLGLEADNPIQQELLQYMLYIDPTVPPHVIDKTKAEKMNWHWHVPPTQV